MFQTGLFFDVADWEQADIFKGVESVWEVLSRIKPYLKERLVPNVGQIIKEGPYLSKMVVLYRGQVLEEGFSFIPGEATKGTAKVIFEDQELVGATILYGGVTLAGKEIFIGEGSVVEPGAFIQGPTMIGSRTEIRQGAYLRGGCLVGDGCVVGHVTEMKNAIMLSGAKAGHFAYIGDSVLGKDCNLGAGTKLANLKMIRGSIKITYQKKQIDTGLRKLGVIMGDGTETGCNSVTNPGTLLGPRCLVSPNATVKAGYYPPQSIIR
jgi:UDP-N-acetylglucosamine diphosphorylase / glucose-1-phosphate thymidylyltransferase / UDP-N-acetylgalactosamine diphosphorylase / glucosamine-1-phosphate N-acetyltransferase / galactosamine-1-phosphate N-acetyltransferase